MGDTFTSPTNPARTYTPRGQMVVSRTFLDGAPGVPGLFEITVIRSWRQKRATYQGFVFHQDGAWTAEVTRGKTRETVGAFADYVDAENALVAVRTGILSYQPWDGPRPAGPPAIPTCATCGNDLYVVGEVGSDTLAGECTRLDLHWAAAADATPEQVARHELRGHFTAGKNRCAVRRYQADLADWDAGYRPGQA
jgi:hypothetical protein